MKPLARTHKKHKNDLTSVSDLLDLKLKKLILETNTLRQIPHM